MTGADQNADNSYDVIVVGSGMGGLTAAAILARLHGKRVLILERHYIVGGLTQVFKRPGNHEWDVGIHYIGDVHEGSTMRRVFDFITGGQLEWAKMPDAFDTFVYPDMTFTQVAGKPKFKADLIARFPAEKNGIEAYFADLSKMTKWNRFRLMAEGNTGLIRWAFKRLQARYDRLALTRTADQLDSYFNDARLKTLLASQWGDHGLPPSKSAFASHALIVNHYMWGAFYPVGGASKIAEYVLPAIEAKGGKVLINHEVKRILVQDGAAIGVEVLKKKGKGGVLTKFYAPQIISNAGAWLTYSKMLAPEYGAKGVRALEPLLPDTTTVVLYLGLKDGPEKTGFRGENHWIFDGYDHEAYFAGDGPVTGPARGCYLSFPSLKNPDAVTHTAEVIGFVKSAAFKRWADKPWMKRGDDYEEFKQRIGDNLLALVEKTYPGFSDSIAYRELSTPLSTEHFTGAPNGAIYGMGSSPARYKLQSLGVQTPVKNLYLTGADAFIFGIGGALMAGVATAGVASGRFGFFKNWKIIMDGKGVREKRAA